MKREQGNKADRARIEVQVRAMIRTFEGQISRTLQHGERASGAQSKGWHGRGHAEKNQRYCGDGLHNLERDCPKGPLRKGARPPGLMPRCPANGSFV